MSDVSHFRKGGRRRLALRVRYRLGRGRALEHGGMISDLGVGGAFMEVEHPPPVGTRLILTLDSPTSWEPLELPAEVRWVGSTDDGGARGCGVRFVRVPGSTAAALYELIHANAFAAAENDW